MPCRSFGLLETGVDDLASADPATRPGASAREIEVLDGSPVAACILHGGTLSLGDLDAEARYFSVKMFAPSKTKNVAFSTRPDIASPTCRPRRFSEPTKRFLATSEWAFDALDGQAMSSSAYPRRRSNGCERGHLDRRRSGVDRVRAASTGHSPSSCF